MLEVAASPTAYFVAARIANLLELYVAAYAIFKIGTVPNVKQ